LKATTIAANGLTFHALEAGSGPLLLCLHGFPDTAETFRHQFQSFAEAGYRVVAPRMRGYHPDTLDPAGCYQTAALASDTLALIDALGYSEAIVYGHDWGTSAAYGAALLAPEKIIHLVTAAVPYGTAMFDAFLTDPEQQRRSWYMYFFQLPFAEAAVSYNNFAFIEALWQDWSPGWQYDPEHLSRVQAALAEEGVLSAALGYYRSLFNPALNQAHYAAAQEQFGNPIQVPTLYFHGEEDGCIGADLTQNLEALFPAGLDRILIPDCGHFVHQEKSELFNAEVLRFIQN